MKNTKHLLNLYKKKRNFNKTEEPRGTVQSNNTPIFVIQHHAARTNHYDFRLAIDGVLKSWAVPKGPSLDPAQKRLAILTEDHPLAYANFEGTIPQGEYGGGTVIIWDKGTYTNLKEKLPSMTMSECFAKGQLEFFLHGKKLQGGYVLIRTVTHTSKDKSYWLLIKKKDKYAISGSSHSQIEQKLMSTGTRVEQHKKVREKITKKGKTTTMVLCIDQHLIEISNREKVWFPKEQITKGNVIRYYQRIASSIIPQVYNKPLSMERFPDGVVSKGFFQKNTPSYFPQWIDRIAIHRKDKEIAEYVVCTHLSTLIYLTNQGCLTSHVWLSTISKLTMPDRIVFDLDPTGNADFGMVKRAAKKIKILIDSLKLTSYVMTTGSRGIHIIVPIKQVYLFAQTHAFAYAISHYVAQVFPTLCTVEFNKKKRGNRIFIDVLRNTYAHTVVAPYSVRACPSAAVATPVSWKQLFSTIKTSQQFTIKNIFRRVSSVEDPWKSMQHTALLEDARAQFLLLYGKGLV